MLIYDEIRLCSTACEHCIKPKSFYNNGHACTYLCMLYMEL